VVELGHDRLLLPLAVGADGQPAYLERDLDAIEGALQDPSSLILAGPRRTRFDVLPALAQALQDGRAKALNTLSRPRLAPRRQARAEWRAKRAFQPLEDGFGAIRHGARGKPDADPAEAHTGAVGGAILPPASPLSPLEPSARGPVEPSELATPSEPWPSAAQAGQPGSAELRSPASASAGGGPLLERLEARSQVPTRAASRRVSLPATLRHPVLTCATSSPKARALRTPCMAETPCTARKP
jgi:hypothetical protein